MQTPSKQNSSPFFKRSWGMLDVYEASDECFSTPGWWADFGVDFGAIYQLKLLEPPIFSRFCRIIWQGDIQMKKLTIITLLKLQEDYERRMG